MFEKLGGAITTVNLVIHLFGTIEDVHHDTKSSTQIFGGFSFSGSSGT